MTTVIEIDNLTKDYEVGFLRKKRVRALDGLSLRVERGEIFGFLGANGAGKSTTMKLLMRLIYPTGGSARVLGRGIEEVSMHARIGYLPEHPYFYDYLTAREFLVYCAELFGYPQRECRERADHLLGLVRLDEKSRDRQLRKFSKGMLQRVGLAQALVNDPEVVFLDEPMSGLDPVGRREVRDLIDSLRTTGTTVFFCSHILSDIEVLCDRAAILRRGRLAHVGRLEELRRAAGERRAMELIFAVADAAQIRSALSALEGATVVAVPGGARVEVAEERDVDAALGAVRAVAGARLVSVQPVGNPLEELFVGGDEGAPTNN
ncbi:MAG: ABC transporter ATP-binding protein [Acidobacteria bacterium]|nr:ABC transporter ATP-binding protein [Acidobacteriota bacterium]MCA1641782.1 ABC transporter ATP-binding protein [Acidobacteriota bacterium]